jgi:glycolate oxidase FAD binding subunit
VLPRFVATPIDTSQVAAVLRLSTQHGLVVVPRGHGTKLGWGMPPRSVDVLLDLSALAGVVDHASGDLVAVVRAGTTLVGGALATNLSGPRRLLYGTARDLLIGVTFVRADGVVAKAGGRVVKNVAGYDVGKLLIGSFGTLAVITEAVVRLHPQPRTRSVVTAEFEDPSSAAAAALSVVTSQTVPSAVELCAPAGGPVTVVVLVEGHEAGVQARVDRIADLLGPTACTPDPPAALARLPFGPEEVGLKVTCSLPGLPALLDLGRRLGERTGAPLTMSGSASGVLYGRLPGDTPGRDVATIVAALREAAAGYGGTVTVLTAPAGTRPQLDMWGPVPGLELMRRVKDELDPAHRLSPGRFVGGI